MQYDPQCIRCEHYEVGRLRCTAFPFRIPDAILKGDFDHTKKFPGQDNDILFKESKLSKEIEKKVRGYKHEDG